jgi:transposase
MSEREVYISAESLRQAVHFLSATEMSIGEIAARMSISKNTVIAINRRFQVRKYNGPGASWLPALDKKKPA